MHSQLQQYAADHRFALEQAAKAAGMSDPVAVHLDQFYRPLLEAAKRRELLPLDGVLVRDWARHDRKMQPGAQLGIRVYEVEGVRFVRVRFHYDEGFHCVGTDFFAVDRKDYLKLYRIACKHRDEEVPAPAPVLPPEQLDVLWKNTIGYLETENLERIKAYGGRARRGVLLTGAPGNGKTMACRWIWEACRERGWEFRFVTPDNYRQARAHDAVEQLFGVARRGIIFFDDMDLALRDRDKVAETEDQAVFLSAMDGITINEGMVFVFTTNCSLDLIDRAFKRPGRLDLVLHFKAPDAGLRRQLLDRWHAEIRAALDLDKAVATTEGFSFAEIEELKNLLVMNFMDSGEWDWGWALKQFRVNRAELASQPRKHHGFLHRDEVAS